MAIKSISTLGNEQDGGDGSLLSTKKTYDPNFIKDYQGKTYDKTILLNLAKALAPSIDANRLRGGVYSTKGESIGFNYDEATNALGYAPSAAEQVVLDMARNLMNEGVTTVDQIQATDTNRRFGSTYSGEGGTIYEIKRDADGNLVTSTWGKSTSDMGNIVAAATIAAAFMGIPADIGVAVLGQGASNLAVNTIGGAIFGGGTALVTGGDVVQGALLGGASGAAGSLVSDALTTPSIYDLSSGTNLDLMGGGQGLTQNTAGNLLDMGGGQGLTVNNLTSATLADAINTIGGTNVANLTDMGGGQGVTLTTPTGVVSQGGVTPVGTTGSQTQAVNLGDLIVGNLGADLNAVTTGVNNTLTTPATTTVDTTTTDTTKTTTDTKKPFNLTPSDIIRIIQVGSTVAALNAAKNAGDGSTQYDIVPVPTDWTSPQSIAQTYNYPTPIDFGTSDLLKGTQWEKYLSQNPTPNRLNEMNYNQLLESLKSNKPVTINDVITGIQSQYAPPSAGQKSAQEQGMTKTKYISNITDWLNANPNATDAQVRAQMAAFGISQQDVSQALNKPIEVIQQKYDAAFTSATPEQKAEAYNSLINQGLTDAQIRTAITADAGQQTDTDWNYLQQLAATTNPAFTIAQPTLTALQSAAPTEKAAAYNTLIGQGFNDAQIRGTINNLMGTQTDTDWAALQQYAKAPTLSSLITQIGSGTPQQKASTYNQLLGQGFSDADIFGAANTLLGPQSQTDWAALQQLAKA
jgi:hypothetical protein